MAIESPPRPPSGDEAEALIREARARRSRRRLLLAGLLVCVAGGVVGVVLALRPSHGSGGSISANLAPADQAACAAATPLTNTTVNPAGLPPSVFTAAHSGDFRVWDGGPNLGVLTWPLYPHYPGSLFIGRVSVAPGRERGPITVTAFNCTDASPVRLLEGNPTFKQPTNAKRLKSGGVKSVTLHRSRLLLSPGDPLSWIVGVLFYKPGKVVIRFLQGATVLDRVTVNVCLPNASGVCAH